MFRDLVSKIQYPKHMIPIKKINTDLFLFSLASTFTIVVLSNTKLENQKLSRNDFNESENDKYSSNYIYDEYFNHIY